MRLGVVFSWPGAVSATTSDAKHPPPAAVSARDRHLPKPIAEKDGIGLLVDRPIEERAAIHPPPPLFFPSREKVILPNRGRSANHHSSYVQPH